MTEFTPLLALRTCSTISMVYLSTFLTWQGSVRAVMMRSTRSRCTGVEITTPCKPLTASEFRRARIEGWRMGGLCVSCVRGWGGAADSTTRDPVRARAQGAGRSWGRTDGHPPRHPGLLHDATQDTPHCTMRRRKTRHMDIACDSATTSCCSISRSTVTR